jgi:hypothetical protein
MIIFLDADTAYQELLSCTLSHMAAASTHHVAGMEGAISTGNSLPRALQMRSPRRKTHPPMSADNKVLIQA